MPSAEPDAPTTVVCTGAYLVALSADRVPTYAYLFRVPVTGGRFAIHASEPDRYLLGHDYLLRLDAPAGPAAQPPVQWLSAEDLP